MTHGHTTKLVWNFNLEEDRCWRLTCFRRHAWLHAEICSERYSHVHGDSLQRPRCEWLRDVLWKTQTVIEVDDKVVDWSWKGVDRG